MKPTQKKFLVLGSFLIACACILLWPSKIKEPISRGKPLGFWIQEMTAKSAGRHKEAEDAVRESGTNAIPWLLELVKHRDFSDAEKINVWLYQHKLSKIQVKTAFYDHWAAQTGFFWLREKGIPAIPSLSKLLDDKAPEVRGCAAACLGFIANGAGSNEIKELKDAMPILVQHLNDPDPDVAYTVSVDLCTMPGQPTLVVPALTAKLKSYNPNDPKNAIDPNYTTIMNILDALGRYGTNSRDALPVIVPFQNNSLTSSYARSAISSISNNSIKRN